MSPSQPQVMCTSMNLCGWLVLGLGGIADNYTVLLNAYGLIVLLGIFDLQ